MTDFTNRQHDIFSIPQGLHEFISDNTLVTYSPGRINLIGEFTDYNNGFVLPAAIDKGAYFAITPRNDYEIHLHSNDFKENYSTTVEKLEPSKKSTWPNYILGVVAQFKNRGVKLNGFDAAISGDIPIGAGLSSSAAVECAVALALNEITQSQLDNLPLVLMAQKAENEFVGVKCGIMDQFASMFGLQNHAIKIDCRSLEYEYIPLHMDGLQIVLLDSHVKHSHGTSEYNVRRKQCEDGVAMIQQHDSSIQSLRDASTAILEKYLKPTDTTIYKRCKFIVEENERVLNACENLKTGDMTSFGKNMFASHDGIRNLYEASCAELDFLVDCVKENSEVIGSRMMGGGFGGCTINIVKEGSVENFINQTSAAYRKYLDKELTPYAVKIEAGSSILKQAQNRT